MEGARTLQSHSGTLAMPEARSNKPLDAIAQFLARACYYDLLRILQGLETKSGFVLPVCVTELFEHSPIIGAILMRSPERTLEQFQDCLGAAQGLVQRDLPGDLRETLRVKANVEIRLTSLPICFDSVLFSRLPSMKEAGRLIMVSGTVIRSGIPKMMEASVEFECLRCKRPCRVRADHSQFGQIPKPAHCTAQIEGQTCNSVKFGKTFGTRQGSIVDYQEIKIQESSGALEIGAVPRTLTIVLQADLVDACKAGDSVSVIGWLGPRWRPLKSGTRAEMEMFLLANNMFVNNRRTVDAEVAVDFVAHVRDFWAGYPEARRLDGRKLIVDSFCPQIYGMFLPKLAVLLVLVGGCSAEEEDEAAHQGARSHRREGHLLFVGDPGTAKSQLLTAAARLSARAVITSGSGSTNAGLTVCAVKDGGDWALEAGALVLADRGLCCIDEFGALRATDRTAIHEAMEQQTLSVAKAGLVCKLTTRCSVLAACNPKGNKFDEGESISSNTALASPLLSRFDLILVLLDQRSEEWDQRLSSAVLQAACDPGLKARATDARWGFDMLKAYIAQAKHQGRPSMTPEAKLIIARYYQMQRNSGTRDAARTTVRLLESLIRLAQSHAKLLWQSQVLAHDALTAIILMESSLQTQSILGIKPGLYAGSPEDALAHHQEFAHKIYQKLKINAAVFQDVSQIESVQVVDDIICSWDPTQAR